MPDWVVWLVVGFIIYKVCIAGSSGCRRVPSSRRAGDADDRELGGGRATPAVLRQGRSERGRRTAETPIQAAQRRFVQGVTTVEEYEAELDRALRERPSFRGEAVTETAPHTSRV